MTAAPWRFRDILPDQAQAREDIAQAVREHLKGSGYQPIETPLLEDQAGLYAGGRAADTPFRLFDDDGRFLVVRPDNTLAHRSHRARAHGCGRPSAALAL